jgi:hypothetical protein
MEYKIIGKGNITRTVSNLFLNMSHKGGVYSSGRNNCLFESSNLDALAKYSDNGQGLIINGEDSDELSKIIKSELNKRKLRLK